MRDDGRETVYVDGQVMRRDPISFSDAMRPPGAEDVQIRLKDLDDQGVWGEVVFPSRGFWISNMTDPELARECARAFNEWCAEDFMSASPRLVPAAVTSVLSTDDAVAELKRAAALGFQAVYLPAAPPVDRPYNSEVWEPLWDGGGGGRHPALLPHRHRRDPDGGRARTGRRSHQLRGDLLPRAAHRHPPRRLRALDRHPGLSVFIAEAGAAWVPALADRMEEGYRQHDMFVRPKLSRSPKETVFAQVYTSFQHDPSALQAVEHMGYRNVMWGSDYPHLEGTFPHTQEVLHGLFDGVADSVQHRVTEGAFGELFRVPARPAG